MPESENETNEVGRGNPAITELMDFVNNKIKEFRTDFYGKLSASGTDSVLCYLIAINLYKVIEDYSEGDKKLIELIWPYEKDEILAYLAETKINLKEYKDCTAFIEKILEKEKSRIRTFEPLFEKLMIVTETMQKMGKYFEDKEFVLKILVAELKQFHSAGMFSRTVINIPSDQLSKSILSRGDLKIQIDIGKPILVAGEEFSIFVKITNPYEVPLVLFSVDTQIPVDLRDVLGESREKYFGDKLTDERKTASRFGFLQPYARTPEERLIAHGISTTDKDYLKQTSQLIPPPILLQPDDSIVKHFILKTREKWRFTPIALTLEIQVKYGVDHREHLDTAKVDLAIQSSLSSIALGAIVGGLAGSAVTIIYKKMYVQGPLNVSSYILLSLILSTMVVVAFARKSGVQKIISIEDFYGGLFLGFMVGLSGPEYAINMIVGQQPVNAPDNLTNISHTMNQSMQNLLTNTHAMNQSIQNLTNISHAMNQSIQNLTKSRMP